MATATKNKGNQVPDVLANMEVEETLPKSNRGRSFDAETIAIRDVLQQQLEDRTARSFKNVEKEGDTGRDFWGRKVRAAGKALGISVSTLYDPNSKKLFFGPEEVINELKNRQKGAAAPSAA